MSYLLWGSIVVSALTLIFYVVFFSFIYYWHETKATFVVVPLLYTFEFLLIAFAVMFTFFLVQNAIG